MTDVERFMRLFDGRKDAFGTGQGRWVKTEPTANHYATHLRGDGPGLGIAPLRDDGTVLFAAIDLDEPDFKAAREMQSFVPGPSFIERSRSGNAHVWVFFSQPIEAWVVRGILKEAVLAAGKNSVEIFPKQDKLMEGMLGNYINLPYYGGARPILSSLNTPVKTETFLDAAQTSLNDPDHWHKRARWLMIEPPGERENHAEFGTTKILHRCAEWIIANRDENPILEGHRAVVYFSVAKMLANYEGFDYEEELYMLRLLNESSPDRIDDRELRRILDNAHRGRFTSCGCDDALMGPYVHPDCPIAKRGM